jgi:hypothetical protein
MIFAAVAVFFSVAASVRAQLPSPPTSVCGFQCSQLLCDTVPCNYGGGADGWTLLAKQYCYYVENYALGANATCDAAVAQAGTLLNATCVVGSLSGSTGSCTENATAAELTAVLQQQCNGANAPCGEAFDTDMCDQNTRRYNVGFTRFHTPLYAYYALQLMENQSLCDQWQFSNADSSIDVVADGTCAELAERFFNPPNANGGFLVDEVQVYYPTAARTGTPPATLDFAYTLTMPFADGTPQPRYAPPANGVALFEDAVPADDGGATLFDAVLIIGTNFFGAPSYADMAMQLAASGRIVVLQMWQSEGFYSSYNSIYPPNGTGGFDYGEYERFFGFWQNSVLVTSYQPFTSNVAFSAVLASSVGGVRFADIYSGSMNIACQDTFSCSRNAMLLAGTSLLTPGFWIWANWAPPYISEVFEAPLPEDSVFIAAFLEALLAVGNDPALWSPANGVDAAYVPLWPPAVTVEVLVSGNSVTTPYATATGVTFRRSDLVGVAFLDTVTYVYYPSLFMYDLLYSGFNFSTPATPVTTVENAYAIFSCEITEQLPSTLSYQPETPQFGGTINDTAPVADIWVSQQQGYLNFDVPVSAQDTRFKVFIEPRGSVHTVPVFSQCQPSYVAATNSTPLVNWELTQLVRPPGLPNNVSCNPFDVGGYNYSSFPSNNVNAVHVTTGEYEPNDFAGLQGCLQVDVFNTVLSEYLFNWCDEHPPAQYSPLDPAAGQYNLSAAPFNWWLPGTPYYKFGSLADRCWCENPASQFVYESVLLPAMFDFFDVTARRCRGPQRQQLYALANSTELMAAAASCNVLPPPYNGVCSVANTCSNWGGVTAEDGVPVASLGNTQYDDPTWRLELPKLPPVRA